MFRFFEKMKGRAKPSKAEKVLESVFGLNLYEARELYGPSAKDPLPVADCIYPNLRYRNDWNVRAASALFQINSAIADAAIKRATAEYIRVSDGFYSTATNGLHINMRSERKFEGILISILTNDLAVFSRLVDGPHSPPPPWAVFPQYDPESLGSLQGEIHFWWYAFWNPFWQSMSEAQQEQYLKDSGASDAWAECIRDH